MKEDISQNRIYHLFITMTGKEPDSIIPLIPSGSERKYYRISYGSSSLIGTYNEDTLENEAFFHFTGVFREAGMNVPEIHAINEERTAYIQQDLGEKTLFDLVASREEPSGISEEIAKYYRDSTDALIHFQTIAASKIDYTYCYPRKAFDRQSILWDLNYFKYNFLKLAGIRFSEQLLEDDFNELTGYLSGAGNDHFMYRDFQSRNILIHQGSPWFIDYQGGRKGPAVYDLASLLFQVKAALPEKFRNQMLEYYLEKFPGLDDSSRGLFRSYFYGFALIRLLQVAGAYGFRGLFQRKPHFLESLPKVFRIILPLLDNLSDLKIPSIRNCILRAEGHFKPGEHFPLDAAKTTLKVSINSFSYKKGIPDDGTGHGGGFVFDCRGLPNPGRDEYYRSMTGKDAEVINYLENYPEVEAFLENVFSIIDQSVEKYISRNFGHLMVSFGCTGGQHRSVYCAEKLYDHLLKKFPIEATINHREV